MAVNLPYNLSKESVKFEIEEKYVKEIIEPRKLNEINLKEVLIQKLSILNEDKRLKKAKKIAILVDDYTRPTPTREILPLLIEKIEGINKNCEIKIIYAEGTHPVTKMEQIYQKIPEDIYEKYDVVIHDAYDDSKNVFVGITKFGTPLFLNKEAVSTDYRIIINSIFPTEITGFTGSSKMIVPGIASAFTTDRNHALMIARGIDAGSFDNVVRQDMDDAAEIFGVHLDIEVIMNPDYTIHEILIGDFKEVYRKGCEISKEIFMPYVRGKSDFVIVSPGGVEDVDLCQSFKALASAYRICDGDIILVAACPLGTQWPEFADVLHYVRRKCKKREDVLKLLGEEEFESISVVLLYRYYDSLVELKRKIYLYSDGITEREAQSFGFVKIKNVEEGIEMCLKKKSDAKFYIIPHAAYTFPVIKA